MGDVLGRKQRIQNSDWIDTFGKIEQLVSKKELDQLVEKTVKDIKKKTQGKTAAIVCNPNPSAVETPDRCISGLSYEDML